MRFFVLCTFSLGVYVGHRRPIMRSTGNRTRFFRDRALATGKTCLACGREATGRVGDYPVCARHQGTVLAPDPEQRWKRNVRGHHKQIRMDACEWCGARTHLTRHHDWAKGIKGQPPKPTILCRRCHVRADQLGPSRHFADAPGGG